MKLKYALAAALIVAASAVPRGEIIEQILVKVNGDIFTKTDLEQRQIAALRQKGQAIDLKSDPNNVQLRKALDEITPQIMVEAIDEMVVVQRGKELGYTLSDQRTPEKFAAQKVTVRGVLDVKTKTIQVDSITAK